MFDLEQQGRSEHESSSSSEEHNELLELCFHYKLGLGSGNIAGFHFAQFILQVVLPWGLRQPQDNRALGSPAQKKNWNGILTVSVSRFTAGSILNADT